MDPRHYACGASGTYEFEADLNGYSHLIITPLRDETGDEINEHEPITIVVFKDPNRYSPAPAGNYRIMELNFRTRQAVMELDDGNDTVFVTWDVDRDSTDIPEN